MKLNREELLTKLKSVQAGIATREAIEQSSCFAFLKGEVVTYNEEIACRHKADVGFEGSVQAAPLLALLEKLPEDEITIATKKGILLVVGNKKEADVRMEKEVTLPIKVVDKPGKWRPLPEEFLEAIEVAAQCVGKDQSEFRSTCVHITPKFIEACDRYQLLRYPLKTKLDSPLLVRGSAIIQAIPLNVVEYSKTNEWIHFRNSDKLVFSCKSYDASEYADMSRHLKCKGRKTTLPKGIDEAIDRANVFSSDTAETNVITIELTKDKLKILGRGNSGRYRETRKVKYNGKDISFAIAPTLMKEVVSRHTDCVVSKDRLTATTGKYTYVSSLRVPQEE